MMSLSSRLGSVNEKDGQCVQRVVLMPPTGKEQSLLLVRLKIG